jgi:DmsE family decaheme c-type cytochrome
MKRCTIPGNVWTTALLMGMATLLVTSTVWADAAFIGTETCLECHDDLGAGFANSVHGRLADTQYPTAVRGCETCHGPGERHAEEQDPASIVRFSGLGGDEANAACLDCHQTGVTVDWDHGAHALADLACVDCHVIHGDGLLAKPETKLCLDCHQERAAQMNLPSHHPVGEGFMACTDCHDVHGDRFAAGMTGEPGRELCLGCHARHRGPFIFEHSPVEEDCMICHDPHGAVANNLLVQNEPFLCLQCHQPHFHTALNGYEGDYVVPGEAWGDDGWSGYEGLSGTSHADGFQQAMMTKCTQCHMSIHGTDLPSQSIPGQGRALNR